MWADRDVSSPAAWTHPYTLSDQEATCAPPRYPDGGRLLGCEGRPGPSGRATSLVVCISRRSERRCCADHDSRANCAQDSSSSLSKLRSARNLHYMKCAIRGSNQANRPLPCMIRFWAEQKSIDGADDSEVNHP